METQVRTPQMIFLQPQRLIVPLFQRPYVWNRESQWEPLWEDVIRVADRLVPAPGDRHRPHFLGAIVLQQMHNPIGLMQVRTIIDGQQRLTTLQLLLDALHGALLAVGATIPAARVEALVSNAAPFRTRPEDQFKVWPTNRDRQAFQTVMGATPPVDYQSLGQPGARMIEAHKYFAAQAMTWLAAGGPAAIQRRANAIEAAVRAYLQMVVIDLGADENSQEIFETLNARGAQLTAADLIKNFVFQRLAEAGADVEQAYDDHWKDFETGFWEREISVGRARYPRSAMFLNHWLVARTGEEVVAREVFDRFKRFADHDGGIPATMLVANIHEAAQVYKDRVAVPPPQEGPVDRLGLFRYRTGVLESEVIKPLLLSLLDPQEPAIPAGQIQKTLGVLESWMVRRMLVRGTSKNYNQVVAELVGLLRTAARLEAGDHVEHYLAKQRGDSRYWPDDAELREELMTLPAYRRLSRSRLRMVLEAIEDYLRGWDGDRTGLGGERVARGKYAIEHVLPRKWHAHWPLPAGVQADAGREALVHTLGNLTLLTRRLNSKVSNGPWDGDHGKRRALEEHDVFLLNRDLLRRADPSWTDERIRERTRDLVEIVLRVWPVPEGHQAGFVRSKAGPVRRVQLLDLIGAGMLEPGMPLFPRRTKHAHHAVVLLADGRLEVDGKAFKGPSEAATAIAGKRTSGWRFFLVDLGSRRSIRDVRRDYAHAMAVDSDEDEGEDEDGRDGDQ